ncbi:alpha/beta fold hydrolase [Arenibacterium halophilum]|uniref:Alpha/beta fold hydrolase n=1 Tax=Arenibacterium halophilum TaxID=2583821 RepID=A0ABY2XBR2_9RHOB|nr:alpha/beta fold hydrolase [Arenibacterium halophilum]TMV14452.1 alpha/beta fold hydrolase [Arenibacterium halophilum]
MEPENSGTQAPVPGDGQALFAELVQLTYATIAEPEKFHDLIELWEQCLTSHIVADQVGDTTEFAGHLNSALQIFDRIGRIQRDTDRAKRLLESFSMPALICGAQRNVLHINSRLRAQLGEGDPLELLANSELGDQVANWPDGQTVAFAQTPDATTAIVTRLPATFGGDVSAQRSFLVIFSDISETNDVWAMIAEKYGLTQAETQVLILLAQGRKAEEIAGLRKVSINTIRAHIRGLLEKSNSPTQADLVRSSVFLISQVQSLNIVSQALYPAAAAPEPRESRLILPSGRMISYREFGARDGRPVLYLHGMMAGPDLPEPVKAEARRHGLRILAPSRPGFGKTDTIPAEGIELVRQSCRDLLAFIDTLSLNRVFVIGNLSAVGIAVNFADRFPDRCAGVLNAGYSGIVTDDLIAGMSTMSRAFARTYQRSRTAIRFLTRAAIASVDFLGAHRMMQRHLGASPVDLAYCERVGCLDLMAEGLRHAIAQGGDAFIKDGYLAVSDWSETIAALQGRVPVSALLGVEDKIAPHALIREHLTELPHYNVEYIEDAGQLVLFQAWTRVIGHIDAAFTTRPALPE